ncbi:PREDICTED: uncharacterized protein LOC104807024 [Tarenaya hassleriana]|uniref:uncharacterized protein LOC104807024 n=1 Tax=Tarenaya hassleriana TaxID=28532 RepID=UPI00053C3DEE|nr:PREDICTED: uncharacterized protein LOC104807024 [Tarenaya hassleriana]
MNQEFLTQFASIETHFKLINNQIAQLVSPSQRPSGSLPGKFETNPHEYVNAITLRSGKQVDTGNPPMVEQGESSKTTISATPDDTPEPLYVPPPLRPPPIPSYTKFLKDILTKKMVVEKETVALTAECSALIQHELPLNRFDPLKPTRMTHQLADRSVKYPTGILEDVPLKVWNFYIPIDFVVLDIDEDSKVPIILRRPFLNTADAVIHVRAGRLTMKIGDEMVEFTLDKNLKQPSSTESTCFIDIFEQILE